MCNAESGDIPIFNNFVQPNIPEEITNFSGITVSCYNFSMSPYNYFFIFAL